MIELILLTSLVCFGVFVSTHEPYVLSGVRHFIGGRILNGNFRMETSSVGEIEETWYEFDSAIKTFIWKPLLGCLPCMASFWGTIIYSLFVGFSFEALYQLPILILSASGLNYVFNRHILNYKV